MSNANKERFGRALQILAMLAPLDVLALVDLAPGDTITLSSEVFGEDKESHQALLDAVNVFPALTNDQRSDILSGFFPADVVPDLGGTFALDQTFTVIAVHRENPIDLVLADEHGNEFGTFSGILKLAGSMVNGERTHELIERTRAGEAS